MTRDWRNALVDQEYLSSLEGIHMSQTEEVQKDQPNETTSQLPQRACPICGAGLIEIRQKLHCSACHAICETCCEGGRG